MSDNISRQAAMTIPVLPKEHRDYISFELDDIYEQGWNECQKFIAELPSADRPRGEWVEDTYGWVYCSHCKKYLDDYQMVFFLKPFDYCPNCGARMLKGGNDAAD